MWELLGDLCGRMLLLMGSVTLGSTLTSLDLRVHICMKPKGRLISRVLLDPAFHVLCFPVCCYYFM